LPKLGKEPKFPQNICPICLLSVMGKLLKKAILKIVQRHIKENNLLHECQFGFRAHHDMTLQCIKLADHETQNFNNSMPTAVVFLDI